jgi:hypothetical protein
MTDDLEGLADMQDPRALPPSLRARLEDVLLSAVDPSVDAEPLPLSAEQGARLLEELDLHELLADLQGPRPVPALLHRRLTRDLAPRRWARPAAAAAAGLTAAGLVGAAVLMAGAGPAQVAATPPSPTTAADGAVRTGPPFRPVPDQATAYTSGTGTTATSLDSAQGLAFADKSVRSATALAAFTPVVDVVSPSSGSTEGGTLLTLTGRNLGGVRRVTVGGVAVAFERSGSSLRVLTPRHLAGIADVIVTTALAPSRARPFLYL